MLLAVSGGADSMALLYGCRELAGELGWVLSVGHVHHGLRGREADRDLAFVRDQARRLGLPFFFRRVDAAALARSEGLSPEAAARSVRYAALREMAREAGAGRIASAHQREDVAESLLLARERRGGVASLAGPRESRADGVVRPLLSVTRPQILAFLSERGVPHRRDASNGDLRLRRNRVRRQLAEDVAGTVGASALARAAGRLAREREILDRAFAAQMLPHIHRGPGTTLVDASALESAAPELARRAISEAAKPYAAPFRPPLTGRERERLLERLRAGGDFRFEAGRRIRFERRGRLLAVRPVAPSVDRGGGRA